jgi:hypothetical protein
VAPVGWWNNTKYLNKKELIPVPYTNMAAISLFWYTNMAAVTSDENDLYHPFGLYHPSRRIICLADLHSHRYSHSSWRTIRLFAALHVRTPELFPCRRTRTLAGLGVFFIYNFSIKIKFHNFLNKHWNDSQQTLLTCMGFCTLNVNT